jgi:c-di-GMP-binding flagellar brake protein YcgR
MESKLAEVKKLRKSGDAAAALEALESARRQYPDEIAFFDLAAEIHLGRGELDRAVGQYEGFLDRNPSDSNALNNYACMLLEGDRPKQAVESLLKAYELDENSVTIKCNLALAFKDLGLLEEAEKVCRKLIEASPNEPMAHFISELEVAEIGWKDSAARLPVGKIVHIMRRYRPIWAGELPAYASRIEEVRREHLVVTAPSRDGVLVPFCAGSKVIIGYDRKRTFWGCVTTVAEGAGDDHQLLLNRPRRMRKVQKRKHFRMLWPDLLRRAALKSVPEGHDSPEIGEDDIAEQDVSATGMSLLVNKEIPKGAVFHLVLGTDREELSCEGAVVRCKQISPGGYEIGMEFAGLSHEDQDRIAGFVLGRRLEKSG